MKTIIYIFLVASAVISGLNALAQKTDLSEIEKITSWELAKNNPVTHLVLIPAEVISTLELRPGDYLGGFSMDDKCCGTILIGTDAGNHCLTLYGDDTYTPEKDGFNEGESILIRKFQTRKGYDQELELQFDPAFQNQGYFSAHGVSALKTAAIAVDELGGSAILDFIIFPNPAREQVSIIWNQNEGEHTIIELFNTYGQRIETLFPLQKDSGRQLYSLDVSGFEKGTWMIRLSTGSRVGIKKLIIIK